MPHLWDSGREVWPTPACHALALLLTSLLVLPEHLMPSLGHLFAFVMPCLSFGLAYVVFAMGKGTLAPAVATVLVGSRLRCRAFAFINTRAALKTSQWQGFVGCKDCCVRCTQFLGGSKGFAS